MVRGGKILVPQGAEETRELRRSLEVEEKEIFLVNSQRVGSGMSGTYAPFQKTQGRIFPTISIYLCVRIMEGCVAKLVGGRSKGS